MNYYKQQEQKALADVEALLALPTVPEGGMYSAGECFDPWDLFPALYGSYSSEFDDLALAVLADIRDRTHNRTDLAGEMFREMLCTRGLCDYGTSPRACFAAEGFKKQLPRLIERWREFSEIMWKK